ncbi:GrlR family regulatory protein [Rhizobacter sp. P5_C2]
MKNGIYHVDFKSNSQSIGQGTIVLQDGKASGGDTGYTFSGAFSGPDTALTARIGVRKWNPRAVSIFGPLSQFDLDLLGTSSNSGTFSLNGTIVGQPSLRITISGQFIGEAA